MKKILALALALAMIFALCACTPKEPAPQESSAPVSSQEFSEAAGTSIDVLREEIGQTTAQFGVAYLGFFDPSDGVELKQWLETVNADLISYRLFIPEIDAAHTIGTQGHLYCVIAKDYASAVSVSGIEDDELLYRSDNGDPILVFCNRSGDASAADIAITVAAADGASYRWEPTLDSTGFPQLLIGDEREIISYDFTALPANDFDVEGWLKQGWVGPTSVGLAGTEPLEGQNWTVTVWDENKEATVEYSLNFYPNAAENGAYDGEIVMESFYEGVNGPRGEWEGWWRIETEEDQPSRVSIDIMLMDCADKAYYENVPYTSESYLVMISPSGEQLLLVPEQDSQLPFMQGVDGVELSLSYG